MALTRLPNFVRKLYGTYIWKKPDNNSVYITFDDGPHPEITPYVVDLLNEYQAKATFFCVGNNVKKFPEVVRYIIENGHQIGNHTMDHTNGWKATVKKYIKDVLRADELINSKLFRPPYGRIKKQQAKYLEKKGFNIIMWSLLTKDYDQTLSPENCWNGFADKIKAGDIIVFHDSEKALNNLQYCLPKLLAYCKANHLTMKSLSVL